MQIVVNRNKTVSEYGIVTPREQKHEYIVYLLDRLLARVQEHGTTKSMENAKWHKSHPPSNVDRSNLQRWINKATIADTIAPPTPKYPQLEDYCHYCTDGECGQCSIWEQLEERREWEAKPA